MTSNTLHILKQFVFNYFLLFTLFPVYGQTIAGRVVNSSAKEPIEYVNIGIVNTTIGTVTNATGNFILNLNNQPPESIVRFSMIGFKPASFTIQELTEIENVIELVDEPYELEAVQISPKGKVRDIGIKDRSLFKVCGWGGTQRGKGHEIGTKIDMGNSPVQVKKLHLRLHSQSFDSSLFRLHIRNIKDGIPDEELLKESIFIGIREDKGWIEVDLSTYNLMLSGEIALTLEWLNVFGVNENKLKRVNDLKNPSANVLFCVSKKNGWVYTRWGSEAKWNAHIGHQPTFYVTVTE